MLLLYVVISGCTNSSLIDSQSSTSKSGDVVTTILEANGPGPATPKTAPTPTPTSWSNEHLASALRTVSPRTRIMQAEQKHLDVILAAPNFETAKASYNSYAHEYVYSDQLGEVMLDYFKKQFDMGMDIAEPNDQFAGGNPNLGQFFFTAAKAAKFKTGFLFGYVYSSFDWHDKHATVSMANGGNGNNTPQGDHARYFDEVISRALDQFNTDQFISGFTGRKISEDFVIVGHSEFARAYFDEGDNGENEYQAIYLISSENKITAGTYYDRYQYWNPDTMNFSGPLMDKRYLYGTAAAMMGVDTNMAGAGGPRILKPIVKGI